MPLRRAHLLRVDSWAQLQRPLLDSIPAHHSVMPRPANHSPSTNIFKSGSLRPSAAERVSTPPMTTHHPLRFTHQNPQITHTANKTVWSLLAPAAERGCTDATGDDTLPNQVHSQKSANHGEVFPWSLHHNDSLATGEQFKISKMLLQGVKNRGMTV
ncbi:hypothetical protein B0H14DRAFT_2575497 [Mycena olivaceomarginata]|nr:hypothetical protein B0H14DRAFT_2575497 [Mycena olivaceomarginata]